MTSQRLARPVIAIALALIGILVPSAAHSALAYTAASGYSATDYATGFPSYCCGVGPVGLAFDPSGNLLAMDYSTGVLYRLPPGGGAASSATQVNATPISGNPAGIAFGSDGKLYATLQAAGTVVQIDTSTGAVVRVVASGLPCPTGLAKDPLSGDLFVTPGGGCGSDLYRLTGYQSGAVTPSLYASPGQVDGIAFGPDGTIYAAIWGTGVARISGTNTPAPHSATILASIPYADGIGIAFNSANPANPPFLFVNRNDGVISKVDLTVSPVVVSDIVTGGSRGDFVTAGADGCLYATQTDRVIKVTNSDGTCTPPLVQPGQFLANRYVVFLDGINSCSSHPSCDSSNLPYLQNDYGDIQNSLMSALQNQGLTQSHFVDFSYGALAYAPSYCAGWIQQPGAAIDSACSPDLTQLSDLAADPLYSSDDTHQAIDKQAGVLDWVLKQIPSSATIDIVGYSLGGVIADEWAATHDPTSDLGKRIHSITTIESPVGGIPAGDLVFSSACGSYFKKDGECQALQLGLTAFFGSTVLNQLRPNLSFSFINSLKSATKFPINSIQSTNDYIVNGPSVAVCTGTQANCAGGIPFCNSEKDCKSGTTDFGLVVGRGTLGWTGLVADHTAKALGGCLIVGGGCSNAQPPLDANDRANFAGAVCALTGQPSQLCANGVIPTNHGTPLHSGDTSTWVQQAITR